LKISSISRNAIVAAAQRQIGWFREQVEEIEAQVSFFNFFRLPNRNRS